MRWLPESSGFAWRKNSLATTAPWAVETRTAIAAAVVAVILHLLRVHMLIELATATSLWSK